MDLLEQFEYPLPLLKTGIGKLELETTAAGVSGSFSIENGGGGELIGVITSNNPCIVFEHPNFKGNRVNMAYRLRLGGYRIGDVIQTSAVIMSNGGEKMLPVVIRIMPPAILTEDGEKIATLNDFLAYAKKDEVKARTLFAAQSFMTWLQNSGYGHMDIYEHINKDPNKARALENFFILSQIKLKVTVTCKQAPLRFEIMPNVSEMISGRIQVKKSDWGFVDTPVSVVRGAKWLEVMPKQLNNAAFDGTDIADVHYKINTGLIDTKSACDEIVIGDGVRVKVSIKKKAYMDLTLSKQFFCFGETGGILCTNNFGKDVMLEVEAKDNFVKFDGKRYLIGSEAQIPFTLRHNAIQSAQMVLKKQQALTSEIVVSTVVDSVVVKKTLKLTVGEALGL